MEARHSDEASTSQDSLVSTGSNEELKTQLDTTLAEVEAITQELEKQKLPNNSQEHQGHHSRLETKFGMCRLRHIQSSASDCKLLTNECEDPVQICQHLAASADRQKISLRDDVCWYGDWVNAPCREYSAQCTDFLWTSQLFWTQVPFSAL